MQRMNPFPKHQSKEFEAQQEIHFQLLVILKSLLAQLTGESSLESLGELTEALLETPAYALAAQHLKQDSVSAQLIDQRYIPPAYDLDLLLTYPKNSLGYLFAKSMRKSGYDPNLHLGMTAKSDAHYVELRLSQTHDIWHIITGFTTSELDEIGLQAFHLAQFPYPLASMLVANSLISSTLLEPGLLLQLQETIARGFNLGKKAHSLFSQRWEEGWEKSLVHWRQELNIQL